MEKVSYSFFQAYVHKGSIPNGKVPKDKISPSVTCIWLKLLLEDRYYMHRWNLSWSIHEFYLQSLDNQSIFTLGKGKA